MATIKSSIETMLESHLISYTVREGHQADVTASWTYKLDPGIWKLLAPPRSFAMCVLLAFPPPRSCPKNPALR